MRSFLPLCSCLLLPRLLYGAEKSDVVMIVADDLRPELGGPYGCDETSATPRLNALMADEHSVTFLRAYAQIALCAPSRNSFLTGRAPVTTKAWQFRDDFREVGPQWTTLPQAFKKAGYTTVGAGKVFHPGLPADWDMPFSWDERMNNSQWQPWLYPSEPRCPHSTTWCALESNATHDFEDTQTTERALELLKNATAEHHYFLAVGYRKPHLQWRFPAQYLLPVREEDNATAELFPDQAPALAFHMPYSEFSAFSDVDECGGAAAMAPNVPYPSTCQRQWRRGYASAVAFLDSQVGRILDAVSEDALVAFFGDHGWHLGEQAEWEKFTNFENAVRVPLILRHSSLTNSVVHRPTELLGLFPTLTRLAGVDVAYLEDESAPLDGSDFFSSEEIPYARSMFPRCVGGENYNDDFKRNETYPEWYLNDCNDVPRSLFTHVGYSLRDHHWRYTAWFVWNGTSLEPADGGLDGGAIPVALELYDHRQDDGSGLSAFHDFETVNLAPDPAYAPVLKRFRSELSSQFASSLVTAWSRPAPDVAPTNFFNALTKTTAEQQQNTRSST
mmetsp:Transcript_23442/g.72095  ORF Transcript_23442/g.72095 Transcript_23442/m.72095 type:complete len:559 (+) Transcript_23442:31-1707(+)